MGNLIIQGVGFDDTEKWDGVAGGWRVRRSVSGMLGLNRRHGGATSCNTHRHTRVWPNSPVENIPSSIIKHIFDATDFYYLLIDTLD